MKKFWILTFVSIFVLGISVGLAACGKHKHVCSNWETVTEATCTNEGLLKGVCDDCGKEMTKTVAKLPHEFGEWQVSLAPTCKVEGLQTHVCEVCGTTEEETVAKIEHNLITVQGTAPTCTDAGLSDGQRCSVCGDMIVEQTSIPATGHTFDEWVETEKATCEYPGEKQRTCSVCFMLETEEIAPLQHKWGEWKPSETPGKHVRVCENDETHSYESFCSYYAQEEVKATCTSGGYTLEVCRDCGHEIKTNQTSELGHLYKDWIAMIIPGGEGGGEHTHKHYRDCERCHSAEARQEDECSLENKGAVDVTCTTAGYIKWVCSECEGVHEEVTTPATGHEFEYYRVRTGVVQAKHYQKCKKCGYQTPDQACPLNIDLHPATCEEDKHTSYSCPICLKGFGIPESGSKLGHKLTWKFTGDKSNPTHESTCERCGQKESGNCEMITVTESLPTCTADGQITKACKYCLESITETGVVSAGHSWVWTAKTDTHHTRTCEKCRIEETTPHNFETTQYVPASCEQQETYFKKCLDCEKEITEPGTAGFGHVWVVDSITEEGHHRTCSNCQATDEGAHDWADCNLCSACKYDCLTYRIEGNHCIVTNTNKVQSANIVIPEYHKVLDGKGGYDPTEYKVQEIASNAFRFFSGDNVYTTTVTIPASIEVIGDSAFLYCRKLKEFNIEGEDSALQQIGSNAFANCGLLARFEAPKSLISIGQAAFANCTSLTEIDVQSNDNLQVVGSRAFYNTGFANDITNWTYEDDKGNSFTDALYIGKHLISAKQVGEETTFKVLDGTITISESAFSDFVNLTKVVLPNSLKIVDKNAFEKCENLAEVEFGGTLHEWFDINFMNDYASPLYHSNTGLHIANAHDDIDLSDKQISRIPAGTFRNTNITSIILPESLTEIGDEAFEGCTKLVSITFKGKNVKKVGVDAFKDSGLFKPENGVVYVDYILVKAETTLSGNCDIKANTLTIADEAFKGCTQLSSVKIAQSVKNVGHNAFAECTGMQTITFEDSSSSWLVFNQNYVGRSYDATELSWDFLKSCTGEWSRID